MEIKKAWCVCIAGYVDREPLKYTITVRTGYNPSRLQEDGFQVYTVKKDLIRNMSKKKSADAQILMRNYMMERFLERISLSEYKNQFILKGGMLVATSKKRGTLDLIEAEDIREIFDEIESSPVMETLWKTYQKNYSYAADIPWHTIMKSICALYGSILENMYDT